MADWAGGLQRQDAPVAAKLPGDPVRMYPRCVDSNPVTDPNARAAVESGPTSTAMATPTIPPGQVRKSEIVLTDFRLEPRLIGIRSGEVVVFAVIDAESASHTSRSGWALWTWTFP